MVAFLQVSGRVAFYKQMADFYKQMVAFYKQLVVFYKAIAE